MSPAPTLNRSLTVMIHGESKVGKSTFAVTAPYPRLMLDVEGGHRFLPIVSKMWDPLTEEPPAADGSWDTTVVPVRTYDDVIQSYKWLQSGKHQFKSLIIDSVSELQVKCLDQIAGREQLKQQQWGELLRNMGGLLRDLRDLTMHPTMPLDAIVLTAMTRQNMDGIFRPYLQGQLATQVPYFYDVLGYLAIEEIMDEDPTKLPYKMRRLYVERTHKYEAGERVQGRLGAAVEQSELSIEMMIDKIYGPSPALSSVKSTEGEESA